MNLVHHHVKHAQELLTSALHAHQELFMKIHVLTLAQLDIMYQVVGVSHVQLFAKNVWVNQLRA